jgi:shikimate dehydrogenase
MNLLGSGIQHSLSPPMWNSLFVELGLDWRYGLIDVPAEKLATALARLREPQVIGFNVTMPHKRWAHDVADRRSEDVRRAQVSNWLHVEDGEVVADNTDIAGARLLLDEVPAADVVLVLGAGGTAAALCVALEGRCERVMIANRTYERAQRLADRARAWLPDVRAVPWDDRAGVAAAAALLVNTTPLGMRDEQSPLPPLEPRDDVRIYDVVYAATPTPLLQQAAAWNAPVADGLAHLEAQAIALLPFLDIGSVDPDLIRRGLRAAAGRAPARWDVSGQREPV